MSATTRPQAGATSTAAERQATVRDVTFDVLRRFGTTTIFGNPGSTEIPFLCDLPDDIHFVLGLHEGSVVGIATGWAIARSGPAVVNLHTAPGLGNAVNAIANARDCRVPLVLIVGQQDRRHLAYDPFLTGHGLEKLGGDYVVWSRVPPRPQDVPSAIARAHHEAVAGRGPALVVVPMSDWEEPAEGLTGWPERAVTAASASADEVAELAAMIDAAQAPAIVVGTGSDGYDGWPAVVALAERLGCPVWQESFARRAGFPQDHELFAGFLPWRRRQMRDALEPHDLVVAVGTGAFRLYLYDDPGPMVREGTAVAVLTEDLAEAHRSPCELAVVAPVAPACALLAEQVAARSGTEPPRRRRPAPLSAPAPGEPLRAGHVLDALAERLPGDAVLVEESPSAQPELYERVPIRTPRGFVAGGNGGLGFGVAGSIGLRMGDPGRPVVGVIGDGSSMYAIQALWSAAHYEVGVLLIVMANGRYGVMDAQARARQATGAWPAFGSIDISGIARCLGCPAVRIDSHEQLLATLDEVMPDLAARAEPLLLEVEIAS